MWEVPDHSGIIILAFWNGDLTISVLRPELELEVLLPLILSLFIISAVVIGLWFAFSWWFLALNTFSLRCWPFSSEKGMLESTKLSVCFKTGSNYLAQASLRLRVFLPSSPVLRDYSFAVATNPNCLEALVSVNLQSKKPIDKPVIMIRDHLCDNIMVLYG